VTGRLERGASFEVSRENPKRIDIDCSEKKFSNKTGIPFNLYFTSVTYYFLGCFDIYDREEALGEELDGFDPNDPVDRKELILKYCLPKKRSYRKRLLLYKCSEESLQDKNYDFQSLLKYDPEAHSSFPDGWDEMENTRFFLRTFFDWQLLNGKMICKKPASKINPLVKT
jgi:hypothetical protein